MINRQYRIFAVFALSLIIIACSGVSNPGALQGTWRMTGAMPMTTITFRTGETETFGIIEKVSYKTEGNDVLVTYLDGIAKGTTMRYTITGPNSARTELGSLHRINR